MKRMLVVAGCLALLACGNRTPPAVQRVAYKELLANGTATFVEVDSAGHLRGGRITPGQAQGLRQDTVTIAPSEAAGIFAAAAGLGDTLLALQGDMPDEPRGSIVLAVLFDDGSQARIVWPSGQEHPDPRVNALARRILEHKVGW